MQMISSHLHYLMRLLFPHSKTKVPGNTIQEFQQHINHMYRVSRKRKMHLTLISVLMYYLR